MRRVKSPFCHPLEIYEFLYPLHHTISRYFLGKSVTPVIYVYAMYNTCRCVFQNSRNTFHKPCFRHLPRSMPKICKQLCFRHVVTHADQRRSFGVRTDFINKMRGIHTVGIMFINYTVISFYDRERSIASLTGNIVPICVDNILMVYKRGAIHKVVYSVIPRIGVYGLGLGVAESVISKKEYILKTYDIFIAKNKLIFPHASINVIIIRIRISSYAGICRTAQNVIIIIAHKLTFREKITFSPHPIITDLLTPKFFYYLLLNGITPEVKFYYSAVLPVDLIILISSYRVILRFARLGVNDLFQGSF